MSKKFSPKEILMPTLVLLLIGIVAAALLGGTNLLTKDKIASINAEAKAKAMQAVMPDAQSFGDAVKAQDGMEYAPAKDGDGSVIGYAFTVSVNGYGGEIQAMVGVNLDGSVRKVEILAADSETPGLGQNVKKSSFLDQFMNKLGELTVTKSTPIADNEIQAVTSATISSKAVTKAVNTATAYFAENLAEGGNGNG